MKTVSFLLAFVAGFATLKSQSIIIYVSEKIKGAEIPVIRTDFNVTVNDSVKKTLTSQADGSLPRIFLYNGSHKVILKSDEFNDVTENNVVIKDFRTTEVTIYVSRKSQPKTEGKK